MSKTVDFRPIAEAGWRVQQVIIENGPVAMTYALAGWLITDGEVVPAYWDQTAIDTPHLRPAVSDENLGWLFYVLEPGQPERTEEELVRELSQLETNWSSNNSLWRQLGISYRDGLALKESGLMVFEEWLKLPKWERAQGFAAWWDEYDAESVSA